MKLSIPFFTVLTFLLTFCTVRDNISEEELVDTKWVADNGSSLYFYNDSVCVNSIYVFETCPHGYETVNLYIDSLTRANTKAYNKKPIDSISFMGIWRVEKRSNAEQGGIWIETKRNKFGYGYTFQLSLYKNYSISFKKDNKYGIYINIGREILYYIGDPDDYNVFTWEEVS